MQQLFKLSFLLFQLCFITLAVDEKSQPYCYKNVTEISYKVVTKTRLKNVSSKNFFKKITFKKDTQVEIYEDQEPVYKIKVKRFCCEGYNSTELDLCEPQCVKNGCPQYSKCVEPEVCECLKGYFSTRSDHDGKHFCEPICEKPCPDHSACVAPNECACKKGYRVNEDMQCRPYCASGCPYDGVCVAPNMCSCREGYKAEKGSCLPICSLGDQCQNGRCVAKYHCMCRNGFTWNNETFKCEHSDMQTSTYFPELMQPQESTDSLLEIETDIETSHDDIDPSQVFNENIESTTFYVTDEYGSPTASFLEGHRKCPDDYIFHQNKCRPLKFVSNEIDCWLKPCEDKHAVCLENGTCACAGGFKAFIDNNSFNESTMPVCLSAVEYEARLQQDSFPNSVKVPINWSLIFFIVVGVLIILAAIVLLVAKLLLKQRGEIDVEGKNLACAYDNRTCSATTKSVI